MCWTITPSAKARSSVQLKNSIMTIPLELPSDRALAKRDRLESRLKKCPDFQLYLLVKSPSDRARMKRLLMEIPSFRLWRALTHSITRARRRSAVSMAGIRDVAHVRPESFMA
jgi:hypothetical protein